MQNIWKKKKVEESASNPHYKCNYHVILNVFFIILNQFLCTMIIQDYVFVADFTHIFYYVRLNADLNRNLKDLFQRRFRFHSHRFDNER